MKVLKLIFPILLSVAVLAASGCSKLPQDEQQAAQTAFAGAIAAEAETYAAAGWIEARDAMARAEAEVEAQNKKMSILRNYGTAGELYAQAQALSEKAGQDAAAAKEQLRQETQTLLESTRTELQTVQGLLAAAPRGKDTRAEIESMQQELLGLQTALDAAAELAKAEDFRQARAQIDQVGAKVAAIRADLELALAKVQTRR